MFTPPALAARAADQSSLCGFFGSPERLTGVGSSLGRVRLGGLGCGKSLWDSPGRDPGVGGATSTTSGSSMEGPPGSMAAAGSMVGGRARRRVGSHRVLPMCSGGHLVAGRMGRSRGGDCSVWFGASDISLDRALERAPRVSCGECAGNGVRANLGAAGRPMSHPPLTFPSCAMAECTPGRACSVSYSVHII